MALQFCDGFDSYAAIGDLVGKWGGYRYSAAGDLAYIANGGRFGGGAVRIGSTSGFLVRKTSPTVDELFLWLAVYPRAFPTSTTTFLAFEDSAGNGAALRCTTSGGLFATQMGATSAMTGTSAQQVVLNAWNTLGLHFKCADSNGRCRLILNGVEQFDYTGDTRLTGGPTIDRITLSTARSGAGNEWDYDDVVLCDASGTAMNTLITTDLKIETLRPTADQGTNAWTVSSGASHYAVVDEAGPDDSDYLSSANTGDRELFTLADPAAAPQTTHALVVNVRGRRTDVGPRAIKALVNVAGAENLSAALALSNLFATLQHPAYLNPDGGGPWTGSALNSAVIGIELGS